MDLISSLADDILLQILSSLDLKKGGRISALSKRWRYVWTNVPYIYNFDTTRMLQLDLKSCHDVDKYNIEVRRFIDYVNQMVSSSHARNNIDRLE